MISLNEQSTWSEIKYGVNSHLRPIEMSPQSHPVSPHALIGLLQRHYSPRHPLFQMFAKSPRRRIGVVVDWSRRSGRKLAAGKLLLREGVR